MCLIFFASYHQFDKMRIALNMDVSLLLSQLVFFIGLPTSTTLVSHNMQIRREKLSRKLSFI